MCGAVVVPAVYEEALPVAADVIYHLLSSRDLLARLGLEKHTEAVLIPADAALVEKSGTSVFIIADGKAKKVPVKPGFNDGASVEILEGLSPDQQVIMVGKLALNNGQTVSIGEAK